VLLYCVVFVNNYFESEEMHNYNNAKESKSILQNIINTLKQHVDKKQGGI